MSDTMHYYICREHKGPVMWVSSNDGEVCPCGKKFEQITKEQYLQEISGGTANSNV